GAQDHADAVAARDRLAPGRRRLEPGVVQRLLGGHQGKLREQVELLRLDLREEVLRTVIPDLRGEPRVEVLGIEAIDDPHAALAGDQALPGLLHADPESRNTSEP